MKTRCTVVLLALAVIGMCAQSAVAQGSFTRVSGTCRDAAGKPLVGAIVRFVSQDNGRKYELKTNSKGQYASIGVAPVERYKVTLIVDGKEVETVEFRTGTGDNDPLDFKLKAQPPVDQKQGTSPNK